MTPPMTPLGETRKHTLLAQRMARLNGVALVRAVEEGNLSQEAWAAMVQRCRGCKWVKGCERFLEANETPETLPQNCRNRVQFGVLKALTEMEENP
ncbi:DUF6455 family protein [Rhodobacteraceae bacterium D3-12]|nr:DUF6455 family protein [Rhodobacteraceae bacterium D3-12]